MNRTFWAICRFLLSFRYRVRIAGLDQLKGLQGPTLVLPNHPAYIDPAIVSSHLRLHKPLRPLVFSGTYRMTLLRPMMSMVNAFEVPDLSSHSRDAQAKALQMIEAVAERLRAGDCMLIYPSGRLQRGNREVVGAARAVHEIVRQCPEINVVLVRTRGVWGSMFSCAETGTTPNLAQRVLAACGWVLANLFLFLPRRPVSLHLEVVKPNQLPTDSREAFNSHLEKWYNTDGGQTPLFVRYHPFLGPSEVEFGKATSGVDIDLEKIKPKTIALVNDLLQSHLGRPLDPQDLAAEQKLEDIGLDSLDRMDLALKIEHQFGFRSNAVSGTLGELWALADGQLAQAEESLEAPEAWRSAVLAPHTPTILADTIGEAFVRRALQNLNQVAAADTLSGVLTYRRMLVGVTLMARRFAAYPEKHVGIMLPASVAADVVFFALQLAGKVPVMMNWTTGPANLAHGVATTDVDRIVTSQKMIDRLGIEVEGAEYVFLEEVKAGIKKSEAVATLLATYLRPNSWLKWIAQQDPEETAMFLFTSGSESLPKTVPLTHRNVLVNVQDGLEILEPSPTDSLLGFLPPFHSFGMTGNLLLPHLSGLRSVRYADPTDAAGLVRTIAAYQPTMVFTTPTFLSYILAACRGEELHSLRIIVTGAEKCPDAVFAKCRELAPQATILEGYGITECAPVVAANLSHHSKAGSVGKPVKHVEVCIVDIDTDQPVAKHQTGMLLVAGPSIFKGYYRHDGPSPFIEVAGKQWYKTGDLVSQDDEGFLTFQGRLKRFLKAGGEMISLPALEEPFSRSFPPDEEGPRVAVEGIETEEGRHIVLFTRTPLTLRDAGDLLLEAGLRGVMRLDEVVEVESIPVLGTGKTDYKELRKLITPI
ncbi:AMP-binding protein [Aureliella helgolandensis]|uniref:AMP-binding protein n=1 Tax=Aureliella helgolandensis TaxID=2527968 RepID=UPI0011A6093B|nr:AMP-binding protein [Aureliella helgolandensis]